MKIGFANVDTEYYVHRQPLKASAVAIDLPDNMRAHAEATPLIPFGRLPPPQVGHLSSGRGLEPQGRSGVTDAETRIFDPEHGEDPATRTYQGEKNKKDQAAVAAWIKNPMPPMPKLYPSPLSEQDVRDVAAYVETL